MKKLGQNRVTKRDMFARALQERAAGIDVERNNDILLEKRPSTPPESSSEEEVSDVPAEDEPPIQPISEKSSSVFGIGLKRPLDLNSEGKPQIKVRKKRRVDIVPVVPADTESEWEGFSAQEDESLLQDSDESIGEQSPDEDAGSESEDISDTSNEHGTESEESSDSENAFGSSKKAKNHARVSAFKEWATQQRNATLGFTPSTNIDALASATSHIPKTPANFTPRPLEEDPLPRELQPTTDSGRKAFAVQVDRSPSIQEARLALPIVAEEQKIMEAVHNNPIVIVQGATGSGKTTQVPQFLYESGYGSSDSPTPGIIGVTQPRRVAAVSMAKRVAYEMGSAGNKVAYQIRFDRSTMREDTAIKFMTDGILLREMATDFLLSKYSAIVIDEAHERSVNTDILIGMLSRSVFERQKQIGELKPLKLIIMSATFREGDFIESPKLFNQGIPPTVHAEGRQYPVTMHFSRQTKRDYLEEAFMKISRGHRKLPPGGFLVFLTGQNEIAALSRRLKETFVPTDQIEARTERLLRSEAPLEDDDIEAYDDVIAEKNYSDDDQESADDTFEDEFDIGEDGDEDPEITKVHVLPLYSQLSQNQQLRVFETPPEGSRLIVLATNVAETSITIPGIRYVFDCGRAKEKHYNAETGVQKFEIGWISKASATQRAGRAGRTGPGHCYRLYSSAVFESEFKEYAEPEIMRTPLEGIVLQLKSMGIPSIAKFPFPTSPDLDSLSRAERLLSYLGAISAGRVTDIGHEIAAYPLNPRYAKIMYEGQRKGMVGLAAGLVAALSVPDLFISENQIFGDDESNGDTDELERKTKKKVFNKTHADYSRWDRSSDAIKLLKALREYLRQDNHEKDEYCDTHFLRVKALREASQLHAQLCSIVNSLYGLEPPLSTHIRKPEEKQTHALKRILASGFINNIALRADLSPSPPELARKPKRAIDVPYITLFASHVHGRDDSEAEPFVYIHPSSVLAHRSVAELPKYVIYSHLQRASSSVPGKVSKVRMAALGDISGAELVEIAFGSELLEWSKHVRESKEISKGKRECVCVPALVGDKGRMGWPLPEMKVSQVKEKGEWRVEKVL